MTLFCVFFWGGQNSIPLGQIKKTNLSQKIYIWAQIKLLHVITLYPHYMLKTCFVYVCIHNKYYISNIVGYCYKNHNLLTLHELLDSLPVAHHISFLCYAFCWVLLFFFNCIVCFWFIYLSLYFFALSSFFLFPQCGQCHRILYYSCTFRFL